MLAYGIMRHLNRPAARATLLALTAAIMLLVGFSRLYLGAHYFSDVMASFTLASAWVTVCITALHVLDARGAFKQPQPAFVPVPVETYRHQPRIGTDLYHMPR
jgi:membrane-associated phospholipid phosphatase